MPYAKDEQPDENGASWFDRQSASPSSYDAINDPTL